MNGIRNPGLEKLTVMCGSVKLTKKEICHGKKYVYVEHAGLHTCMIIMYLHKNLIIIGQNS